MLLETFIVVPPERVAEFTGNFGSATREIEPFEYEYEVNMLFLLPIDVLTDPEFASIHDKLAELEQIEIDT